MAISFSVRVLLEIGRYDKREGRGEVKIRKIASKWLWRLTGVGAANWPANCWSWYAEESWSQATLLPSSLPQLILPAAGKPGRVFCSALERLNGGPVAPGCPLVTTQCLRSSNEPHSSYQEAIGRLRAGEVPRAWTRNVSVKRQQNKTRSYPNFRRGIIDIAYRSV